MKTLKETIDDKIDEIMDTFDFSKCAKILKFLKECGDPYPAQWFDGGEPEESCMRIDARRMLRSAAKETLDENEQYVFSATGYFKAAIFKGQDDDGAYVRVDLTFGLDSSLDAEGYEPL